MSTLREGLEARIQPKSVEELNRAFYAEVGKRVSKGIAEKASRGLLPGALPLGYRYDRTGLQVSEMWFDHNCIVLDQPAAGLIQKAFELADRKKFSTRKLLAIMTERGLWSRRGKPLRPSAFWKVMTNPFYSGIVRAGDKLLPGRHQALVSKQRFDRIRAKLSTR
jgi:hypothetical protein